MCITPLLGIRAAEDGLRLVRETDALSPERSGRRLHVPAGFDVQLFAAEPMINKPINIAFDARGRSVGQQHRRVSLRRRRKDRWSDRKAPASKTAAMPSRSSKTPTATAAPTRSTDFADGLNIPTGVLPWHKPEHKAGCIAWSIPNIWYFADTDGDGKADKREVLFGPLGYEKDTHGMCSSFRLGLDGWVYATHGFNNTSHFKAKDGSDARPALRQHLPLPPRRLAHRDLHPRPGQSLRPRLGPLRQSLHRRLPQHARLLSSSAARTTPASANRTTASASRPR